MRGQEARSAFPERQSFIAAALHLTHEENPEAYQEKERSPGDECRQPWTLTWLFARDLNLLLTEHIDQFRVVHRHHGLKHFIGTVELSGDVGIGDCDLFDVALFDFLKEAAEWKDLRPARCGVLHYVVEQHGRRQYQDPEQNRFCCRIQIKPPI